MSKPIEFKVYAEKISEPIREDGAGATDPGPRDILRALENPDMLVPSITDAGTVSNLRFSFSDTQIINNCNVVLKFLILLKKFYEIFPNEESSHRMATFF